MRRPKKQLRVLWTAIMNRFSPTKEVDQKKRLRPNFDRAFSDLSFFFTPINRLLLGLALTLTVASGVVLYAHASTFYEQKLSAQDKYGSCLAKIEQQAAISADQSIKPPTARTGIWPCFHQQIAASKFTKDGAFAKRLLNPSRDAKVLHLATLLAWLLLGIALASSLLKQRQRDTD